MMSEWMKVMLEEIGRKKAAAQAEQIELEQRGGLGGSARGPAGGRGDRGPEVAVAPHGGSRERPPRG
jgi:hypothetical protein